MDTNTTILILIFIFAVIVLSIPLKCMFNNKEGFGTYNGYYKQYSENCYGLDSYACDKCYNCGSCGAIDGSQKCVPGDSNGAYFADCAYWRFSDPSLYYPQTHRFPMIYSKSMYPYSKTYPMKSIN